jgi:hypothetical protein
MQVIVTGGHVKAEDFLYLDSWGKRLTVLVIPHLHLLKQIVFFNKPGLPTLTADALAMGLGPVVIENFNPPMPAFLSLHEACPHPRIYCHYFLGSLRSINKAKNGPTRKQFHNYLIYLLN